MIQKFYTNTIQSGFIKSLLKNTPLPIYNTIKLGEPIIEGSNYIYNKQIIKCTKSGFLGGRYNEETETNFDYGDYEVLDRYNFGESKVKFTTSYYSKYNFYDSSTHERLGEYLRCYRDFFDINLMPFYNCFSGRYNDGLTIQDDGLHTYIKSVSYKTFKIPIKFNKTYTIALDSLGNVHLAPIFMRGNNLLKIDIGTNDESVDLTELAFKDNHLRLNSSSFRQPFTWRFDNYVSKKDDGTSNEKTVKLFNDYENNLFLFIQVSSLNTSSLVVLEGDYTNTDCYKVFNAEEIWNIDDVELNKLMLSNLSLLQFSDGVRYPFADRLIEYLLLSVISSEEEITGNIRRIQQDTGLYDTVTRYKDIWTAPLRKYIYDLSLGHKLSKRLDLNGFVDRDTEKIINRERKT